MRASRLLAILVILQVRDQVSARELAERFEVSRRTIYRDIDELSAAGVPVYAELGANGGFSLAAEWNTQLSGVTSTEAEALVFAGLPGPAADLGIGAEATSARLKILAAMATDDDASFRIAGRFHFDPTPWHRRRADTVPHLRTVAQGVWEARRLRILYESWEATRTRVVEPLGLILKAGEWYFACIRRGRTAIYKVEKVREATILPHTFTRPARFDLARAWADSVASFEAGLRRSVAVLRVQASAMPRIDRLGAAMAEPILLADPDGEGLRQTTVQIESVEHAASLLLAFGPEIEVIAPLELRQELFSRASLTAELYR